MKNKEKANENSVSTGDLQEKYNVKVRDIKKAIKGVIKFRIENPKVQNKLLEDRVPLFLQFSCLKIPKGYSKILRIPLRHTVLTPEDEVCLIVPDVKGIKNIEHEKHVEHYEDLLHKHDVRNIKKIMTFHELRTEYETFEQRSRLVDLYDVFLADGRISGRAIKKCGKLFYKKRKVPVSVKLYATKVKDNIEKALSKVFLHLHLKGDSFTVQFGHDNMDAGDMVENVFSIIKFLDTNFPGGFANIKGMHISCPRATSIPIYLNFKNPTEIKAVKMESKTPKAYKSYTDEITTLHNAEVLVEPTGNVIVKPLKKKNKGKVQKDKKLVKNEDVLRANVDNETDNIGIEQRMKKRKYKQIEETNTGHQLKKKKFVGDKKDNENDTNVSKKHKQIKIEETNIDHQPKKKKSIGDKKYNLDEANINKKLMKQTGKNKTRKRLVRK